MKVKDGAIICMVIVFLIALVFSIVGVAFAGLKEHRIESETNCFVIDKEETPPHLYEVKEIYQARKTTRITFMDVHDNQITLPDHYTVIRTKQTREEISNLYLGAK